MSPAEADKRIIHSRRVLEGYAGALAAGDLAAPPQSYIHLIGAELVILRQLASEHPGKADKITYLVERYEALSRHMKEDRIN